MARKRVVIFGQTPLARLTEKYFKFLELDHEIIMSGNLSAKDFDIGVICTEDRFYETGTINLSDIKYVLSHSGLACRDKIFFIRSKMSVGQTGYLNKFASRGCSISYFPNLHSSEKDFGIAPNLISVPRMSKPRQYDLINNLMPRKMYQGIMELELELACHFVDAIRFIQNTTFNVLYEITGAHGLRYPNVLHAMMLMAEPMKYFTIYGATQHDEAQTWAKTVKGLSHNAAGLQVLGRALLDVVDGLNDRYNDE